MRSLFERPWKQSPGGQRSRGKWLMILLSVLCLFLVGFFLRKPAPLAEGVVLPGKGTLVLLSMVIVFCGLLFWWGVEKIFWRKYFPTQDPQRPIESPRGKTGGRSGKAAG